MRWILFCISLALTASPLAAQDGPLGLAAPPAVVDSGLLKHLLPRFSLKTGIRVAPDAAGPIELADTPPGTPVFQGGGITYYLRIGDDPRQVRFRDWLTSEIGQRTVDSFQPDGTQPFSASFEVVEQDEGPAFEGDAVAGAKLSLAHCGRCHVIGPQNRMNGLGSTPSFAMLRGLPDWDIRFQQFYVRRPHGAFTQIDGITPPFDAGLPPPIFPVRITENDLDAILAFVAATAAADLGAPLQLQ